MDEEQIFTDVVKMEFNSEQAFNAILDAVSFKVPEMLHGVHSPTEVICAARDALVAVFKTIFDDMKDPKILKHLECLLIAKTDLHKMINKKMMEPVVEAESSIIMH